MNDTKCCLTKIGLSTQNEGYVTICNQSRVHLQDKNKNLIRLDRHSLQDAWLSPTRKEIDESLSNGIRHDNCQDCWDEEAANKISRRQIHNKEFENIQPLEDQPRAIILKPGNTCNLSCRHCSPSVSSGWYRDSYKLENSQESYFNYTKKFNHIKLSYDKTNTNFWNTFNKWIPNLIFYDLYGGEPLLTEKLYENLKFSADNNFAINQNIHINTNGTIWKDDFNSVFSKFNEVYFDISADGVAKQFEYMRYPAKWDSFLTNLYKYKDLAKNFTNIKIGITITVSLYNIFYLPEIYTFYKYLGVKVGVNILHTPEHLNIRIAPDKIKSIIAEKLVNEEFLSVIKYLNLDIPNKDELYTTYLNSLKKIDLIRNEKYNEVFPEMAKYLND